MKKRLSVRRLLSLLLLAGVVCMPVSAWQEQTVYAQAKAETDVAEHMQEEPPSAHAAATSPSSATAAVTEHTKTDATASEQGKEFYTIQTASEKVFYLIIDRDGAEEVVYFLTEISEQDLLNVTADSSAAIDTAIPSPEDEAPDDDSEPEPSEDFGEAEEETSEVLEAVAQPEERSEETAHPVMVFLILGVFIAGAVGIGYAFQRAKKKNAQFLDEDDDEDEEEEEILADDEEENDGEDDFFADEKEREDD